MFRTQKIASYDADSAYQSAANLISKGLEFNVLVEKFLMKADHFNHPLAAGDLGIILFKKADTQRDYSMAFKYLNKALELNHSNAILYSAFCFLKGLGTELNIKRAIDLFNQFIQSINTTKILRESSKDNLIYAFLSLAEIYLSNVYGYTNPDKAYYNLCRAEQLGSLIAKYNLASLLLKRCNNESNSLNRVKLQKMWLLKYTELAEHHYENTEFSLGCYYAYPNKNPSLAFIGLNIEKSIDYFWRAGLGGNYTSFYHIYKIAQTINPELSLRCFKLAVQLKDPVACLDYGSKIFYNDSLNDLDRIKGLEIVKSLAKSTNNVVAQYACGLMTIGLFQNESDLSLKSQHFWSAVYFLRKSANAPHYFAKFELAKFLIEHGIDYINACQAEVSYHLKELIKFSSPTMNPNIIQIQMLAKDMLENLQMPVVTTQKKKSSKNDKHRHALHKFVFSQSKVKKKNVYSDSEAGVNPITLKDSLLIDNQQKIDVSQPLLPRDDMICVPKLSEIKQTFSKSLAVPSELYGVLSVIEEHGFVAYVVGGYVRDKLTNLNGIEKDIDIVTSAPIEFIEKTFNTVRSTYIQTLCSLKINGMKYDIQTIGDIQFSLSQDALKRDFTINSLYLNSLGVVFDPLTQGLENLFSTNNQLVSIGDFAESITMDPFRILRFLVFLSRGFTSQYSYVEIQNCIKGFSSLLNQFLNKNILPAQSENRIEDKVKLFGKFDYYLCKILQNDHTGKLIDMTLHFQLFQILFPNVDFKDSSLQWMKARLAELHAKSFVDETLPLRKNIYLILLATMVNGLVDIESQLKLILESTPLPVDLRWKISANELKVYVNEKSFFNILPPEKQPLLNQIISSQMSNVSKTHTFTALSNLNANANEFFIDEPYVNKSRLSTF